MSELQNKFDNPDYRYLKFALNNEIEKNRSLFIEIASWCANNFIERTNTKWEEKYAKLKMVKEDYEEEIQLERKRTEAKYSHVCKTCHGVGQIGHQLRDGTYEDHTCQDCVGHIQKEVWLEAIEAAKKMDDCGVAGMHLEIIGKRKGYIKC